MEDIGLERGGTVCSCISGVIVLIFSLEPALDGRAFPPPPFREPAFGASRVLPRL